METEFSSSDSKEAFICPLGLKRLFPHSLFTPEQVSEPEAAVR